MERRDRPREQALRVLRSCEQGGFADDLLSEAREAFAPRDNAFIRELVYGVLRNRSCLDWYLNRFSSRPVVKTDGWTRNILRLAAYQLAFLDKVPASAAVDTAVELAKQFGKKPGYVNGLLRALGRSEDAVPCAGPHDPLERLAVRYSHPRWLVRRWASRLGQARAEEILRENNRPAPLVVRTNRLRTSREELRASLEAEGAVVRETGCAPAGIVIVSSPGLRSHRAFAQGWFVVQDEAAQLVGLLAAPRPGDAVLDACAAPGGKTTHLAEMMQDQGTLVALESDPKRTDRIRDNCARLGITAVRPVTGDAAIYREGAYDTILVDAPCSGLGVLRRHPDGRWTKIENTIRERAILQQRILENCAQLLRPGGALVYATCTTEPEENEDVVKAFLADHRDFRLDDPLPFLPLAAAGLVDAEGFLRTFPNAPEMDGFFGARVVKKP